MTSTLLLLVIGAINPIVVPAYRDSVEWVVHATIDGKRTPNGMQLSAQDMQSVVAAAWLQSVGLGTERMAARRLAIGGGTLGLFFPDAVGPGSGPTGKALDGILGWDVLSKVAIGFDETTSSVEIWPGGRVPPAEARRWVASGKHWPGDRARPTCWVGKLGRDAHGAPTVPGSIGGKPAEFLLDLTGLGFEVPRPLIARLSAERVVGLHAEGYVTTKLQVGPGSCVSPIDPIEADDHTGPVQPSVSLNSIPSRRTILDFPARKIYCQRLSGFAMAEVGFCNVLPVHLDGSTPRIGPCAEFPSATGPRSNKYENDEVISFNGLRGSDLAAMLRAGTGLSRSQLRELAGALGAKQQLTVRHHGKVMAIVH